MGSDGIPNDGTVLPTVRFAFTLRSALLLGAQPGRFLPCLHQVRVDVGADGRVVIGCYDASVAYGIERVIEQALRFLKIVGGRHCHVAQAIPAELSWLGRPDRVDNYVIAVGAAVSITASRFAPALVA